MDVKSVVDRAIADPEFAENLRNTALAVKAGKTAAVDKDALQKLLAHFSISPAEIARMEVAGNKTFGFTTTTTATTFTTAACTTTGTTTTTTGN